jgi:hypothetical protein
MATGSATATTVPHVTAASTVVKSPDTEGVVPCHQPFVIVPIHTVANEGEK